jgi:hypothetical protein
VNDEICIIKKATARNNTEARKLRYHLTYALFLTFFKESACLFFANGAKKMSLGDLAPQMANNTELCRNDCDVTPQVPTNSLFSLKGDFLAPPPKEVALGVFFGYLLWPLSTSLAG